MTPQPSGDERCPTCHHQKHRQRIWKSPGNFSYCNDAWHDSHTPSEAGLLSDEERMSDERLAAYENGFGKRGGDERYPLGTQFPTQVQELAAALRAERRTLREREEALRLADALAEACDDIERFCRDNSMAFPSMYQRLDAYLAARSERSKP